jgi:hypothetical protein
MTSRARHATSMSTTGRRDISDTNPSVAMTNGLIPYLCQTIGWVDRFCGVEVVNATMPRSPDQAGAPQGSQFDWRTAEGTPRGHCRLALASGTPGTRESVWMRGWWPSWLRTEVRDRHLRPMQCCGECCGDRCGTPEFRLPGRTEPG